ncbi:MAG TPA: BsuPI-related putative proteinase inhibitor, partial [Longimicrobium sp.]|nr:BsuPI-related putative proteinase inhibitor [Longimicrobium sp.]
RSGGDAAAPEALASSLQVEASAEGARLVLRVTNVSGAPLALVFPTGQTYDFAVREENRELWRWSAGRGFTQAVREETLAPGETRTWAETWSAPAALRGRALTAVARLASSTHPVERTSPFALP